MKPITKTEFFTANNRRLTKTPKGSPIKGTNVLVVVILSGQLAETLRKFAFPDHLVSTLLSLVYEDAKKIRPHNEDYALISTPMSEDREAGYFIKLVGSVAPNGEFMGTWLIGEDEQLVSEVAEQMHDKMWARVIGERN